MTKKEFLSQLQDSLEGNIPKNEIAGNLQYYSDYFSQSGKSETEVCEELGDPRLIARSIIDAFLAGKGSSAGEYIDQARAEYSGGTRREYHGNSGEESKSSAITQVLINIGFAVITIAVFVILFKVLSAIAIPLLIIVLVLWMIRLLGNRLS